MNTLPLRLCCISIALLLGTAHAADAPVAPATAPATLKSMGDPTVPAVKIGKSGPLFLQMHEKFLKEAKEGNIDLLFLGDSITANWTKAPEIWAKNYAPLHAVNFGIGGDRTQHVLWRITNGELDGIHPKVCVLMIGTNNSNSDSAESIADAITKIVSIVREKTGAKVLLLAVFPRDHTGATHDTPVEMETIHAINERIAKLDDGKNVRYLDISQKFMGPDGKLDHSLFSDGLHPNVKGYQIWTDSMHDLLTEMMQ
jgi:lysophospholipase L1-like esterase